MKHEFTGRSYELSDFGQALHWIGGEWTQSSTGRMISVTNPRHGQDMGSVAFGGAEDVASAVHAAQAAFPAWKDVPIRERAGVFYRLKALMEEHLEELAWLVSHENGKTFEESVGSVLKAIECVEFGCSLPNLAAGKQLEVSRGVTCLETHEPLGVVAVDGSTLDASASSCCGEYFCS
jgi:malonate-semialdehyde dehydrogenase (acetylating)/methylmalonate-semialdehyde dehydrogenase